MPVAITTVPAKRIAAIAPTIKILEFLFIYLRHNEIVVCILTFWFKIMLENN
jgi:hypothetical protein